jgi:hypothetical protein
MAASALAPPAATPTIPPVDQLLWLLLLLPGFCPNVGAVTVPLPVFGAALQLPQPGLHPCCMSQNASDTPHTQPSVAEQHWLLGHLAWC